MVEGLMIFLFFVSGYVLAWITVGIMCASRANDEINKARKEARDLSIREDELKREYTRKVEEIKKLNKELKDKADELELKYKYILAKTQGAEDDK